MNKYMMFEFIESELEEAELQKEVLLSEPAIIDSLDLCYLNTN